MLSCILIGNICEPDPVITQVQMNTLAISNNPGIEKADIVIEACCNTVILRRQNLIKSLKDTIWCKFMGTFFLSNAEIFRTYNMGDAKDLRRHLIM